MGARLGRYVMLKRLASGGMADVFLARSDGIQGFTRHVVIKRIRRELARDQRFIRMFLDEARVAAFLHHQHIVQVHDVAEVSGEYFIAMEYVHGEDVRKILSSAARQRNHMPLGYATAIVSAAAAGLHYAHERCGADKQLLNIVHRDVSPSNILVGYDGSIKVVDFGIATASMREETRSGSLKGKLSYMSPEQCKGIAVDRRSDVYALGVVLYELATTAPMIRGENDYLVMEQIVHGRIPPPQSRRPSLPGELCDIILRALSTDRDHRYATADDLRCALERFATSAGLTASTSAIAAYMRQHFGQRPEPWLELDGPDPDEFDDDPAVETVVPSGWVEPGRGDDTVRASADPSPSSPGAGGIATISEVIQTPPPQPSSALMSGALMSGARMSGALVSGAPPPTAARRGWRTGSRALRGLSVRKMAALGALPVAAVAVWLITRPVPGEGTRTEPAPPALGAAAVAPAAPPPKNPEPAPLVLSFAATPEPSHTDDAPRIEPPRRARAAAAAAATRPAQNTVERLPGKAKPEHPTRAASATSPETLARGDAGAESGASPAAPPTSPPQNTPPAPSVMAAVSPPALPAVAMVAPAPMAPQIVAPSALDAYRLAGDKLIIPDAVTMTAIGRAGIETVVSTYKICVTSDGAIHTVTQIRSTGFPAYDEKIRSTIRNDWRYRPYLVNGKATPVCTALRFVYSQK
jgi:serine/threonine protein kinase